MGFHKIRYHAYKRFLKKYSAISQVVLFGSRAKGDYRKGSDIDLSLKGAVSFNDLLTIETEIDDLLLPEMVDMNRYDDITNKALKEHINRVGKVIYEKSPDPEAGI